MEDKEAENAILNPTHRSRLWFYLEWIPISLLSIGILLRHQGNELWQYLIVGGGIATAVIYLLFSTVLLNARRNNKLEMLLSITSGLLVAFGVGSLIANHLNWAGATKMILISIYAGLGMIFIVAIAFIFQIRNPQSSRFYRDLLARLFIFIALIYSLGF